MLPCFLLRMGQGNIHLQRARRRRHANGSEIQEEVHDTETLEHVEHKQTKESCIFKRARRGSDDISYAAACAAL